MSNNEYPYIVQNAQSTVNTTVQPTQLNGGNLSEIFNLQAMRIVKGRVNLTTATPSVTTGLTYTVVNEYDGSPVTVGPSDFVVAYGICNGNPNDLGPQATGSTSYTPLYLSPATFTGATGPNSPLLTFALNSNPPTYSTSTGLWTPASGFGTAITTSLTTGTGYVGYGNTPWVNLGYGTLTATLASSAGSLAWLQLNQQNNPFTIVNPSVTAGAINITLLVISGFPNQ
jgi:hypothetical protein